ncbi:MAG TPA: carboxypeptidase-like regulatory domain-containing protein [Terriglobales bacterium]|nr:carboxypeptidase-like regulatory domain-containing protein [Terriglobales bacterium]
MVRKLGYVVLTLGLVLPVWATGKPGTISGYVKNSAGIPQMGAVVELLTAASSSIKVFTNDKGFYRATGVVPGVYSIRVSAPTFLPSFLERVSVRSGAALVENITLTTIFEAFQLAPHRGVGNDDDWKWTLRSVVNRPILRIFDENPVVVSSAESNRQAQMKASLSFLAGAGSTGYGDMPDMTTGFSLEHSLFSSGILALNGNVGYGNGNPSTVVRASYSHEMANGSKPEIGLTIRRFATPDPNLHTFQALALSASDGFTLADVLELNAGSELQTIQFMGRQNAFRPFASADLHLSPNTVLEYSYRTTRPTSRLAKGFDSSPADFSETNPRLSLTGFSTAVESAHHHELSLSRHVGPNNFQVAGYSDRISNPALLGVGELSSAGGDILPDIYSGTFTYGGTELKTQGIRAVFERKLNEDLTASLDYSYGGVLDLDSPGQQLDSAKAFLHTTDRHALGGKLSGKLPRAGTRWIAAYRWSSGRALTPVDLFDNSPGQVDPFFSLFVRQPVPDLGFLPAHMEILLEIRNLLAQGYVPVLGEDGRTLYLVQSARALRGGVSFNF